MEEDLVRHYGFCVQSSSRLLDLSFGRKFLNTAIKTLADTCPVNVGAECGSRVFSIGVSYRIWFTYDLNKEKVLA